MPHTLSIKLADGAKTPVRGSSGSIGYDLFAFEPCVIPANGSALVSTGVSLAIPTGLYGQLASRSSMACKRLTVEAGVIDNDYRGEVKVLLYNHGSSDYTVETGNKVAQLILIRAETPDVVVVDSLEATTRGSGGFGSTGV